MAAVASRRHDQVSACRIRWHTPTRRAKEVAAAGPLHQDNSFSRFRSTFRAWTRPTRTWRIFGRFESISKEKVEELHVSRQTRRDARKTHGDVRGVIGIP